MAQAKNPSTTFRGISSPRNAGTFLESLWIWIASSPIILCVAASSGASWQEWQVQHGFERLISDNHH